MDSMFLLDALPALFPGRRLLAMANLAAERAHDAIWLRVIRQALTMNEHEARGYIRSRAAAVIQRESSRILYDAPALQASRDSLIAKATEIAVASIWSQVASLQRESQSRRRAA
jgi:hypothetical protein